MLAEGMTGEGERIISSVRERYNGENRNPWNEIECGSNYARSMASFALMPIYAGMSYDLTRGYIGFSPISGEGSYFFSVGGSWGCASVTDESLTLELFGDPLTVSEVGLPEEKSAAMLEIDGTRLDFDKKEQKAVFNATVCKSRITVKFVK